MWIVTRIYKTISLVSNASEGHLLTRFFTFASSKKLLESLLGTNHDFTQNVKQTPDNHPLDEKTLNTSRQPKKAYYATSELE